MKNLLIPFTIVAFLISSCDIASFDDDINKDPNAPSEVSAPQLIANAMLSLPSLSSSPQGEYNAQFLAKTDYVSDSQYLEGGTSFYWLYQDPLINLQTAIDNSNVDNQIAVARILKAYYFWHLTDRWGDVPYSEALQGTEDFTPAYDTQEAIYTSLFDSLKAAADQINPSADLSNDIMYDGDMNKWIKFSNTVRLLMALRLSEVDPQRAESEFNDALSDGIMESNDDNFVFQHLAEANNQNYWYGQIVEPPIREWWALSENLVGMMEPVDDPRLPVYGDTTASGDYVGLPFGTDEDEIPSLDELSLLGDAIHAQGAPVYLVTYAQALFARAEAAERGWIAESAEENYQRAIEQSLLQWTGSTDDFADFYAQPEITYDAGNAMEQIASQRYIHLFMHGYEGWAEYRRTGYPDNMVNPNGREVPLRQSYASEEALNNTENYNEAVQRQFGDGNNTLYGRLWWDVE